MTLSANLDGKSVLTGGFAAVNAVYDSGTTDPYPLYRECRETMPVMEGDLLVRYGIPSQADFLHSGRPVKTLFRYHDIASVLKDQETFSAKCMLEGFATFFGDVMMTGLDNAEHRRLRNLMQPAFGVSLLKRWKPLIRESMVQNYIRPMLPHGKAELVDDFAVPFPVRIVYEIMGFPNDMEASQKFAGWALTILSGFESDPGRAQIAAERAATASQELYAHILPIVAGRRAEGAVGEDMIAHLLRADEHGAAFSDHQVTSLVIMLLTAATETTTRTFGNMIIHLIRRPELLARVRADRSLVKRVISETMRFETVSAFLARIAVKDTEIAGIPIAAGTGLSLATGSANRDDAVFENGDTFDIDRPLRPNIAFGAGAHTCMGMPVANIELETALDIVLDSMPNLRFDPDYPEPVIRGLQLRGPSALHVRWD